MICASPFSKTYCIFMFALKHKGSITIIASQLIISQSSKFAKKKLSHHFLTSLSKLPDVRDVVERNPHCNVQLCSRHVHPSNGLGHWVLHLKTWVELQEAKGVSLRAIQIFHGSGTLTREFEHVQNRSKSCYQTLQRS